MDLHHVGIATEDAGALADRYEVFGTPVVHEEEVDGLAVAFLEAGGVYLELLEPTEAGTVAEFLEERGPGLHHVALAAGDLGAALDAARERGIDPVESPRPGAWGHEVAFLHPRSTGGVLIELVGTATEEDF